MWQRRLDPDAGLGLVEVIIAMFLLALITIAIFPALYNGIRYSSQQSSVATATRQLNSFVEQVRQSPTCAFLSTTAGSKSFVDGTGRTFTTSGTVTGCASGSAAAISLTATQSGRTLAAVNALVYIP